MRSTPTSLCLCASFVIFACSPSSSPDTETTETAETTDTLAPGVAAVVNGVEITENDIVVASQPRPGQPVEMNAERRQNLLELTIRRELEAQEATRLELELADEERAQLDILEAAARTYRRTHLAEALERNRRSQVEITEAQARRYFEENASRLRSEVHVWQILVRDEAQIQRAFADIEGGASFEEVARSTLPGLAEGQTPWDLGYMRWNQVPEPWREPLAGLEPGQTSGVIAGLRNRFWLIHVAERRENPAITFETERATIEELLRAERLQSGEAETTRALRAGARIVYGEPPVEPSAPTDPHSSPEE